MQALFNQNEISIAMLNHLTRVYSALAGTSLAAVLGVFVQQQSRFPSELASLLSLGLAMFMQGPKVDLWKLLGFGFFNGMSLGGLIRYAQMVDPSIVPIALSSSTAIFASFAGAATLSTRRSMLYLYGILGSALSVLTLSNLANMFLKSTRLFSFNLYSSLFMFVGYVCADSQLILERAEQGDQDYVTHAWLLFTDLSGILSRTLIIMLKAAQDREKRKRRRNRDQEGEEE